RECYGPGGAGKGGEFWQDRGGVGLVEHRSAHGKVEVRVGVWQSLRVCLLEFNGLRKALIASQGTCFGQNVGVDIGRDNRIGATQPIGESARDRTRTTSDLQHPLPPRDLRWLQHLSV